MKAVLMALLIAWAGTAPAEDMSGSAIQQTDAGVLEELTMRSGLSETDMKAMLDHCDATQHSIDFCAQRDELVADRKLQRVIADKKAQAPACTAVIDARVAAWQKKRDVSCDRSAARDFGGGSMEAGARLLCRTANTTDYTSKLASERVRCRNR